MSDTPYAHCALKLETCLADLIEEADALTTIYAAVGNGPLPLNRAARLEIRHENADRRALLDTLVQQHLSFQRHALDLVDRLRDLAEKPCISRFESMPECAARVVASSSFLKTLDPNNREMKTILDDIRDIARAAVNYVPREGDWKMWPDHVGDESLIKS